MKPILHLYIAAAYIPALEKSLDLFDFFDSMTTRRNSVEKPFMAAVCHARRLRRDSGDGCYSGTADDTPGCSPAGPSAEGTGDA